MLTFRQLCAIRWKRAAPLSIVSWCYQESIEHPVCVIVRVRVLGVEIWLAFLVALIGLTQTFDIKVFVEKAWVIGMLKVSTQVDARQVNCWLLRLRLERCEARLIVLDNFPGGSR